MRTIPIFSDLMDATGYDFDDEFLELFQTCKVPESIWQILNDKHLTSSALFALQDDDVLEECIQFVGTLHDDPPDWNTSVEASSIRHLHHSCWNASRAEDSQPKKPEEQSNLSQNPSGNLLELAWADLPPVRVKERAFLAMKEFSSKYPSESLSSANAPCARLVATLMQQKSRKAYSWVPWKERLRESRWLDIQLSYMADDDLSGAPFFIQGGSREESHRFGLDQICHLSVGKKYLTNSMRSSPSFS